MTQPLASTVRIATTPEQAKILVAQLQAEGIPAHVDGNSLADEFAMSRRLMNLTGVRVMVPTKSLEQAHEILARTVDIAPDDLEQQALTADDAEQAPVDRQRNVPPPARRSIWPLLGALGLAVVFLGLWLEELTKRLDATDPLFEFVPEPWGLRQVRRFDGSTSARYYDEDSDRIWERIDTVSPAGVVLTSCFDANGDGSWERLVEQHGTMTATFVDQDGDGVMDTCTVDDAQGNAVQHLRWRDGAGYVIEPR